MKFSDKVASTQEASEKEDVTEILRKKTETANQSINQLYLNTLREARAKGREGEKIKV